VNYQARFYRAVQLDAPAGGQIPAVNLSAGNEMTFGYATTPGRTYILQASTNLAAWDNLTTNLAPGWNKHDTHIHSDHHLRRFGSGCYFCCVFARMLSY
jgi:hypothetical protein